MLWICFMNGLLKTLDDSLEQIVDTGKLPKEFCGHVSFADDLTIWLSSAIEEQLAVLMSELASVAAEWFTRHGIPVSDKTTATMFCKQQNRAVEQTITLHLLPKGHPKRDDPAMVLKVRTSPDPVRLLGVHFDQDGDCNAQSKLMTRNADMINKVMISAANFTHPHTLRQIYSMYSLSKTLYGAGAAGDYANDWLDPKLQGKKNSKNDPRAKGTGRFTVPYRSEKDMQKTVECETNKDAFKHLSSCHDAACRIISGTHSTTNASVNQRLAGFRDLRTEMECRAIADDEKSRRTIHQDSPLVVQHWLQPLVEGEKDMPLLRHLPYEPWEGARAMEHLHYYIDIAEGVSRESEAEVRLRDNWRRFNLAYERCKPDRILTTDGSCEQMGDGTVESFSAAILLEGTDVRPTSNSITDTNWWKSSAGRLACSYSAETYAGSLGLDAALRHYALHPPASRAALLWVTDSRSLLEAVKKGPIAQTSWYEALMMKKMIQLVNMGVDIHMVFAFSHCDFQINELVDDLVDSTRYPVNVPNQPEIWHLDSRRIRRREVREDADIKCNNADKRRAPRSLLANYKPNPSRKKKPPEWCVWWPEKLTRRFSAADQKLLNQLKTGCVSALGGHLHDIRSPCPLCGKDGVLARHGAAIEHLFKCTSTVARDLYSKYLSDFPSREPDVLWKAPREAIDYTREFLYLAKPAKKDLGLELDDVVVPPARRAIAKSEHTGSPSAAVSAPLNPSQLASGSSRTNSSYTT